MDWRRNFFLARRNQLPLTNMITHVNNGFRWLAHMLLNRDMQHRWNRGNLSRFVRGKALPTFQAGPTMNPEQLHYDATLCWDVSGLGQFQFCNVRSMGTILKAPVGHILMQSSHDVQMSDITV